MFEIKQSFLFDFLKNKLGRSLNIEITNEKFF
jgi:hypothetical protein